MSPTEVLQALKQAGLERVLNLALERYRRDGKLGRSQPALSPAELEALQRLTGQTHRTLDLQLLDEALQRSRYQTGLVAVLETLQGGPILPRRVLREQEARQWTELLGQVAHPGWREALSREEAGAGLLRQLLREGADLSFIQTISKALGLLEQQPWRSSVLGAQLTGDAHFFDSDRPPGRLLQAAVEALGLVGLLRDGVSSTVLCAGVLGDAWLEAGQGRALCLTWREVNTLGPLNAIRNRVWVVENPSVFEGLLEAVGPAATLVCTSGQPSAAAWALLDRLASRAILWVSCDFDLGGLRIAGGLYQRYPHAFVPWRFDRQTYLEGLSSGSGLPLQPNLPYLFPDLCEAMQHQARAIHQELILPRLIQDLSDWLVEQ